MLTTTLMALRYLAGRKLRTALTTLAVVFGVAVIFAGNLTLPGMLNTFRKLTLGAANAVDLSVTSRAAGAAFAPERPLELAAGVPGVQAVTGVMQRQIGLPAALSGGVAPQIEIVGVDPATVTAVREFKISAGRFLQPGDRGVVVLSGALAEAAPQLRLGASVPLITAGGLRSYTIVGLLADRGPPAPQFILPLADAQEILGQPGLITTIEIALQPGVDRIAVTANVLGALGDSFEADATASVVDAVASLQLGYAIFNLLGLLALFIGAFLIFNTFRTVIVERRHDLAMLRSIGAGRGQVTQMLVIESLIQGLVGSALGLLVGYGFAAGLAQIFEQFGAEYMPGVRLEVDLSAWAVVQAAGFGLLTTLLAGYLPARSAGKISPIEALRPATAADLRRAARWSLVLGAAMLGGAVALLLAGPATAAAGALLFLLGIAVATPGLVTPMARLLTPLLTLWFAGEGDIAQGNMVRQPGRAAITASTLMIGLAVLVMAGALATSLGAYIRDLFTRSFASDMLLLPQNVGFLGTNLGADERLAERLRALPQVQAVGSLRPASSAIEGKTISVLGIDPISYPQVSPLTFTAGDPDETYSALASGRVAVANPIMASSLKLKPGQDIVLQTPEGPRAYRLVAIAGDALNFKINTLFISQANLRADFHKVDDVMLMIKLKSGADLAEAREAAEAIVADYPQLSLKVTADYRNNLIDESLNATTGIFYVMALIILLPAGLGLLNTLMINVLERTREIGIVRAVGGSRRHVRRMVTAEALLLGLFGAAIGVLAGLAMSYGFVVAFGGVFGVAFPYSFPLAGALIAAAVGVLLALGASLLPARSAARLEVLRALRYE